VNCATFQSILPAYTAYEDGTDSVPKRRHIKFRLRCYISKYLLSSLLVQWLCLGCF